jgi:hypothetical protein
MDRLEIRINENYTLLNNIATATATATAIAYATLCYAMLYYAMSCGIQT